MLLFFFQAEDGIRDADVTGVQTCALPIWILDPVEQDSKLVAPKTRHRINLPQARLQPLSDFYDQSIAIAVAQTVVDVLEAIQIEKQNGEEIVALTLAALNRQLQIIRKHTPIRQVGKRIVKRCVTKVLLTFLEGLAGTLQLRDIVIEFFDVSLRLLSALSFGVGTSAFSFCSLALGLFSFGGGAANVFQILLVSEIENEDHGNGNHDDVQAPGLDTRCDENRD